MDEEVKKDENETEIFDLLKRLNVKESFPDFDVEELKKVCRNILRESDNDGKRTWYR